jgi:hypothetical protein
MQAIVDDILQADALIESMRVVNLDGTPVGRLEAKICCQLPKNICFKSGFILRQSHWITGINYSQRSRFYAGTMLPIMAISLAHHTTFTSAG